MKTSSSFRTTFFRKKASSSTPTDVNKLESTLQRSKFLLCCEQGDVATLRAILSELSDEESKDNDAQLLSLVNHSDAATHKSGLIFACIAGHTEVVTELMDRGVDIERGHDGSTPLYHAVSRGHIEVARLLLEHGARVDAVNSKGWSCLMNAAYFGRDDIVKLLLQHGADPDITRTQFDGKSALHFGICPVVHTSHSTPLHSTVFHLTLPMMQRARMGALRWWSSCWTTARTPTSATAPA